MKNISRPLQMYTVLTGDPSTIFINQVLTSLHPEKHVLCCDQNFQHPAVWAQKSSEWTTQFIVSITTFILPCLWMLIVQKGSVNDVSSRYWPIDVCGCIDWIAKSFLSLPHVKLSLYCTYVIFVFIWHISHPAVIVINYRPRECNKM
jgi:hypothetical protein